MSGDVVILRKGTFNKKASLGLEGENGTEDGLKEHLGITPFCQVGPLKSLNHHYILNLCEREMEFVLFQTRNLRLTRNPPFVRVACFLSSLSFCLMLCFLHHFAYKPSLVGRTTADPSILFKSVKSAEVFYLFERKYSKSLGLLTSYSSQKLFC